MKEIRDDFTPAHELIYKLKVQDAMTTRLITVRPENTMREVQRRLRENRISGMPVVDGDKLVGIVSIEDIINALDKGYIEEKVGKWMTKDVVTIQDNISLIRAVAEFEKHRFGRLPVVDEKGKLIGIITRGDIVKRLMLELNKIAELHASEEAQRIVEASILSPPKGDVTIEVSVKAGGFDNAGIISSQIKRELEARGIDRQTIRRAAIALYEAETNIIIHSIGGKITAHVSDDRIRIKAVDWGPGIEDVEQALQPGFSTASEFIRALGFGAGMGLNNIQRCADKFMIKSTPGVGTELDIEIYFTSNPSSRDAG
ncbi:TPA: CBS domain-containing protein [Candidatus Poribacteria bacterium]|nr:CBS domain-containing protein [Candidatus Poribacteria bacterium]